LGLGGYLDQVQFTLGGELSCPLDGDDSQLLAGGVIEETDSRDADLVVDPELSECDRRGLLVDIKNWTAVPLSRVRVLDLQGKPGR
jgi:hypothetical protein